MFISALTAGVSGLSANQRALDVAANNVANANTANFQPQQANFQESIPAGGGVTLSVEGRQLAAGADATGQASVNGGAGAAATNGGNGVDVAREITNTLVYDIGARLSANVVKSADQVLGSLIDVKS